MNATDRKVLVWDLPVRVGHWLLATCFVVAWLTGESEEWRLVHVLAGGGAVGVVLFRLLWGLFGSRYALFVDFISGPRAAWCYLKSLLGSKPMHCVGHNPAGGWAIVALLGLALVAGATGWTVYQDIGGEWLAELHEGAANAMLLVVLIHLAGVLVGSLAHRENLVRPMLTGRKDGGAGDGILGSRPVAAMLLLAWVAAVAWWMSL
ncbi:MAG: cytochrome b/b6 domain-containing protein [Gammaproteobacteria bacterium]|nr:cytochrome b/b6 domain-containing protein [Gammaproteobacteria bacterium]MBU1414726.1 cytochrome b/b6 domain-containing protein [Gammaproteobacteria bacterium]